MWCTFQSCWGVIWPNYVKCLAKCLSLLTLPSPVISKKVISLPHSELRLCDTTPITCIRVFAVSSYLVPEGVSFYELKFPVQGTCILTARSSSSGLCSAKFHANITHSPAEILGPMIVSTQIFPEQRTLLRKPRVKPLR